MRRLRRFEAISRNFYIRARVRDLLDLPLNLRNLRRPEKTVDLENVPPSLAARPGPGTRTKTDTARTVSYKPSIISTLGSRALPCRCGVGS